MAPGSLKGSAPLDAAAIERVAQLFDQMEEAIAVHELVHEGGGCVDYVIVAANVQYALHVGVERDALIGRRASAVLGTPEAPAPPYLREYAAAVASQTRLRFDVPSAGLEPPLGVLVIPLGPTSFATVLSDIAARKKQEEALETGRLAQRALLDNQPHLTWLKDVEGRFLAVNKAFAEACGLSSPEALVGRTDLDVWPRELAEAYRADDASVMATRRQKAVEEPIAGVDGTRWFETYKSPVYAPDGSIVGTTGVARDVTQRKLAEQKALRAEEERRKMELSVLQAQKLESLGVLAGGIAHDFNNLLTTILGNADLARTDVAPLGQARFHLDQIDRASRHAADLCRQMLAYSGKGRFVVQRLSLNELVGEMGNLLSISTSKKATLSCDFADHLPGVVADASQLRQVVMNLITNASEALADHSGEITLRTGALVCDRDYFSDAVDDSEQHAPGRYVFLEVSDTGAGMDAETLARIFDPFFSTKFAGRGLGLAAVLGIVRGHKGALKVASQPGKGTTFRVLLPADESPKAGAPEGAAAPDQPSTPSAAAHLPDAGGDLPTEGLVLVADDEESVRTLASHILTRAGFQVITAADGREALEIFDRRRHEIRVVLLDMTMPHMDGEATFAAMRQLNPDAKILLTSGYNEQEVGAPFVGRGSTAFVQKPYRTDDLLAKVREILAR